MHYGLPTEISLPSTHFGEMPTSRWHPFVFFAQQSVEKCLKAVLFFHGIEFPPIHDLAKLAQLLSDHGKKPPYSPDDLRKLNPFAVVFRYDDQDIETFSRDEAQVMVESTRRWVGNIIQS